MTFSTPRIIVSPEPASCSPPEFSSFLSLVHSDLVKCLGALGEAGRQANSAHSGQCGGSFPEWSSLASFSRLASVPGCSLEVD